MSVLRGGGAAQAGDPTIPGEVSDHARQLGAFESPVIWITLLTAAIWLVALTATLWHRKRARTVSGSIALCCLLLAAVTGVNSYVGYVRTNDDLSRLLQRGVGAVQMLGRLLDDGQDAPDDASTRQVRPTGPVTGNGTQIDVVSLPDPAHAVPAGKNFVVLPPGYHDPANAGRRYPVVYLIHGYPFGGPEDWLTSGDAPATLRLLLRGHTVEPMILVSVDMTAGKPSQDWECLNVPGGPQLESYLSQTVVPAIDGRYRTIADRAHRALGGMSGGGFGAFNIGLHHVDQFGSLLIALPYDDPGDADALFRGDAAAQRANTPREYLPTMPLPQRPAVILTAGTGAPTDVATARRIAAALGERGIEAVVHTERGFNHTWHTARATLPYLLAFADQHFPR
ncbi:alpha/beta hydrolase [Amycolatopsis sp. CA-230715]|uniref:alpha/beta hydrolase n=1 Tax=Amycolatopsis sp. CA-230715 TaxID=2745196 RepID=UPI001C03414C|nr:alpha/beta hydrolase-fold protein [Amycolatopsis sp. CA-230715]QWF85444.1 hypothetical protein HUW46_08898 [Amycolatopsis sp. CA-230715]